MLTNGISDEHAFMRNSMLYNHLEALEFNRKKGNKNLNFLKLVQSTILHHLKKIFYLVFPQD